MSIPETIHFDNTGKPVPGGKVREVFRRVWLALMVLLVGLLGYALGRLSSVGERKPVEIRYDANMTANGQAQMFNDKSIPLDIDHSNINASAEGSVYASSRGTKYYYRSCKSTISEANRITFATPALAEKAGYTLAANCRKP